MMGGVLQIMKNVMQEDVKEVELCCVPTKQSVDLPVLATYGSVWLGGAKRHCR